MTPERPRGRARSHRAEDGEAAGRAWEWNRTVRPYVELMKKTAITTLSATALLAVVPALRLLFALQGVPQEIIGINHRADSTRVRQAALEAEHVKMNERIGGAQKAACYAIDNAVLRAAADCPEEIERVLRRLREEEGRR